MKQEQPGINIPQENEQNSSDLIKEDRERLLLENASLRQIIATLKENENKRMIIAHTLGEREIQLKETQRLARLGSWSWDIATDDVIWSEELYNIVGRNHEMPAPRAREHHTLMTPESWRTYKTVLMTMFKTGTPFEVELELCHSDGTHRWVLSRGAPLYNDNHRVARVHGTLQDITEQKKNEQALCQREQELLKAQEIAQVGSWTYFPETKSLKWSLQTFKIFGLDPRKGEPSYRELCNFFYPVDWRRFNRAVGTAISQGTGYDLELQLQRSDGSVRNVVTKCEVMYGNNGETKELIGTIQDITEHRALQTEVLASKEKAEAASLLKSNLLSNMSHEFRTPLNGILGIADILQESLDDAYQKELLTVLIDSGRRLFVTLNDLLKMARLASGDYHINLVPLSCSRSVHAAASRFFHKAEAKKLLLLVDIREDISISADEDMVACILQCLIDNAVKFTEKGDIRVIVERRLICGRAHAVIHIKDTGIGIGESNIDIVFQEFRQLSEGATRKYEGSGLGLSLAKKMIEMLGGKLTIESKVGAGSTFTVMFPEPESRQQDDSSSESVCKLVTPETVDDESKSSVTGGSFLHNHPSVLVVEDEIINAYIITHYLNEICKVDHAMDAETALLMMKENNYRAIFTDIDLGPGMDGIALMSEVRKMPEYDYTPIFAITGYDAIGDRQHLLNEGFEHCLSKPVKEKELTDLVKEVLFYHHLDSRKRERFFTDYQLAM